MKRKIFSILTALVMALSLADLTASADDPAEKPLTSETLRDFVLEVNSMCSNAHESDLLDPLPAGKDITFSKPFKAPDYWLKGKKASSGYRSWLSALFVEDKLYAVIVISYHGESILFWDVLYMPYELTAKVDSGEEISLFWVDASVDMKKHDRYIDSLLYSVDKDGGADLIFAYYNGYIQPPLTKKLDISLTGEDYKLISEHNVISKDMEKAVTVTNSAFNDLTDKYTVDKEVGQNEFREKYSSTNDLTDNGVIVLENVSDKDWSYNGSREFIVRECGRDKDGEMMYTLSPKASPKKTLKFSGSDKLYFRCAYGGNKPIYKICPVSAPDKALTVSKGKGKVRKWARSPEQQWFVHISL